jgi:hypothetical protein
VGGLFPRTLSTALPRVAGPYPFVNLGGPRQSGKITLARATFPDFAYVNLEDLQRRVAVAGGVLARAGSRFRFVIGDDGCSVGIRVRGPCGRDGAVGRASPGDPGAPTGLGRGITMKTVLPSTLARPALRLTSAAAEGRGA